MTNAAPMDPKIFFPELKGNLTNITWAHAVNNKEALREALANSLVNMLEADVIMGYKSPDNVTVLPIMAHPPANSSDLSLEDFLNTVHVKNPTKGLKLDFKSMEAFTASRDILKKLNANAIYPVFINADIFPGPINADNTVVKPNLFLEEAKQYENVILSIGWSTKPETENDGKQTRGYTDHQVKLAIDTLKSKNLTQPITYAVRANLAAVSPAQIEKLMNSTEVKNTTLTIWSSKDDKVDASSLSKLIKTVGVENVYLDVPSELKAQLNLKSGASGIAITTMTMLGSLLVNYLLTAMPQRG
ncbi:protein FAM151B isoform X2 [Lasioglossum baleicum]